MAQRPSTVLTQQELAVMKQVWRTGHATVREVYEALLQQRRVAYTTVMTVMKILETKGFLRKEPEGRAYRYRPTQTEAASRAALVRDFVERVFDGATTPLLAHLVTRTRLTKAERDELKRIIDGAKP